MLDKPLAKFMTLALTVVMIGALLFSVGYKLIDSEVSEYNTQVSTHEKPSESAPASHR